MHNRCSTSSLLISMKMYPQMYLQQYLHHLSIFPRPTCNLGMQFSIGNLEFNYSNLHRLCPLLAEKDLFCLKTTEINILLWVLIASKAKARCGRSDEIKSLIGHLKHLIWKFSSVLERITYPSCASNLEGEEETARRHNRHLSPVPLTLY